MKYKTRLHKAFASAMCKTFTFDRNYPVTREEFLNEFLRFVLLETGDIDSKYIRMNSKSTPGRFFSALQEFWPQIIERMKSPSK